MEAEKQFKVLVVDDNLKNIQVIGNILKETNYSIGYATDGKQALDLLQKTYDFDLVLLDIDMPVMDGFETCKAMRKDRKLKEVPVIFLTAFTEEEKIVEGFNSGAQDYITKPFHSKELLSRVKTHLHLKYNSDQMKSINQVLEQKVDERTKELSVAYEKLSKALNQLQELDNAKTEFLQIISHEIRTPLNGIIGFLEIIKRHNSFEKNERIFKILNESVKRLEHFSLLTLDISVLRTQGSEALNISNIDLKLLIENCMADFKEFTECKNIHLKILHSGETVSVKGDVNYLNKVFEIIIGNAIKHTPKNKTVVIESFEKGDTAAVRITDSGQGFPDTMLDQSLPSFITGKDHVNTNIGIDLHFVKLVMNAHSGNITIGNNKNKGAFVLLEFKR